MVELQASADVEDGKAEQEEEAKAAVDGDEAQENAGRGTGRRLAALHSVVDEKGHAGRAPRGRNGIDEHGAQEHGHQGQGAAFHAGQVEGYLVNLGEQDAMSQLEKGGDQHPQPHATGESLGETFNFPQAGDDQPDEGGDQYPEQPATLVHSAANCNI